MLLTGLWLLALLRILAFIIPDNPNPDKMYWWFVVHLWGCTPLTFGRINPHRPGPDDCCTLGLIGEGIQVIMSSRRRLLEEIKISYRDLRPRRETSW